jgi:hypothetical protein
MRAIGAIALAVGMLVGLTMPATVGAGEQDRAKEIYFVDARGEADDTRTSLAIRGHRLTSGYVFNDRYRCRGFRGINLIDFAKVGIRNGNFHDVDQRRYYKDRVRGERLNGKRIKGRAVGVSRLRGPDCRFVTRFTLEKVGRAKWRRYTKKARKFDRRIGAGTDHREAVGS